MEKEKHSNNFHKIAIYINTMKLTDFHLKIGTLLFLFITVLGSPTRASEKLQGQISGIISDESSGEGLPYATILLTSSLDSSFSKGIITDSEGNFSIGELSYGSYIIEVSFMGFEKKTQYLELNKKKINLNIKLRKKEYSFSEVEVSAEKELKEEGIEKTTVNVTKNMTLSGGNALDVMQSLPSVDLDINGQIQYRGSNRVTILINGKPSELVKSLEQIPADQIEKVELINNPSAKYEADGMSGIINVVMKSTDDKFENTSLNIFYGYPKTTGGSLGLYKQYDKATVYLNGSANLKTQFQTKEHWRYNYEDLEALDYYQYDRQDQILQNYMLSTGANYKIKPKHQVGISLIASGKTNFADRNIDYQSWDKEGAIIHHSNKDIEIHQYNYVIDGSLDYQFQINKTQKLETNLHYNFLDGSQKMSFDFYPIDVSNDGDHDYQKTYSDQLNKTGDLSLDYTWDISDSSLLESGYFYSHEDLLNDFRSESYNHSNENWQPDTSLANQFHYLQAIHAAYINLERKLKYFDFQIGLRGEFSSTNQFVKAKEEYFDLFPSLRLSKKLDKYFKVYGTYNRRINRPILKMINPYTNEYADILNMHIGNPDLKPEYVNSFELGTQITAKKSTAKMAIYYRRIDQAISRVKSASNDSALLVTFMNLDQAQLFGGELNYSLKATKWWQVNANVNIFYTTLQGIYGPNQIDKSHTGWTASMKNQFKLPWKLHMQFNMFYKSALPDVLGTYQERYYADLAVSKKVLKNKGKFIFKISDVFNTYKFGLDLVGLDENGYHYQQINRRKNESQYFILSFVYNFSGKEKKKKKENFYLEGFGK